MKYFLSIVLTIIFFTANKAHGFLNIESLRQSKEHNQKYKGSSQIGISDYNGNINKTILHFSSLNMINQDKNNYIFLAKYNYGRSSTVEDVNDSHIHFRYTRQLNNALQIELFQQTEFDKFQDLNLRYLLGTGIRQRLFQKTKHSLYLGIGAFYEKEKLNNSPDQSNPRGNIYLSYIFSKKKKYSASIVTYFQPNTQNFSDQRIRFNLGLETYFGKYFIQQWQYSLARDSRPPSGVHKSDSKVSATIGLTY